MTNETRTKSSIKSMSMAATLQIAKQILEFGVRTVFIALLPIEYLGVNGLFTNILTCMSLAELGVGSALVYSMYKPMAEGDHETLKTYMNAYKNIYRVIGIVVLSIGIILLPFLDFFVSGDTDIPNLRLIFILYVLKNTASYFFAYKQSAFSVDQKQYVITMNNLIVEVATAISRVIVLVVFRNFVAYLLVSIMCIYLGNIRIAYLADKEYPYLKEKEYKKLDGDKRKGLVKNVSAMFLHKLSYVILGSTDNIILSKIFGLVIVGLYSNYQILLNVVKMVFDIVADSIVPSVGNFCASESKEKMYKLFNTVLYINIGAVSFCCIGLYCLSTPFIRLWIGNNYVMDNFVIFMLVLSIYIQLTMRAIEIFRTATGLFVRDKIYAVLQCVVNIVVSIIAAYRIGPAGIFIGTSVAMITTRFWSSAKYVYNEAFCVPVIYYYKKYLFLTAVAGVCFFCTCWIGKMVVSDGYGIGAFAAMLLITLIVPNGIFVACTFWTDEFKDCLKRIQPILNHIKKKSR